MPPTEAVLHFRQRAHFGGLFYSSRREAPEFQLALFTTLAALSQTAASNAPDGSTDAPSTIDDQLRLLASFVAQLRDGAGSTSPTGDRNLLVNSNGATNQRVYVSGTATTVANQVTLDRWRVVTSGQSVTFGAASPDRTITAPAGGLEQVIEAGWIVGGIYTLAWTGSATATVNGVAITSGGQTSALAANTAVTVRFTGGTFTLPQFELGSAPTPYQRRPLATELTLCQRDYAKSYVQATALGTATATGADQGYGVIGGGIAVKVGLPVVMRTTPTISLWSNLGVANQWIAFAVGGGANPYAASSSNISDRNFTVSVTPASGEVFSTGQWAAATGF